MIDSKLFYFLIISLFWWNSSRNGGVAFTFDDQYIDEWLSFSEIFDKYDIKATFYISRPHLLDSQEVSGLRELQSKGHEIACHGLNHKSALDYKNLSQKYISEEIIPAIEIFYSLGFNIESFAYPFGHSFNELDSVLMKTFNNVRKARYNSKDTSLCFYPEIFANKANYRIINSMGIDYNYRIDIENIKVALMKAKKNQEVVVFYAHRIDSSNEKYSVHPEYLEEIFRFCKQEKIKSLRIKDLEEFFNN